jgi:pyruvate,water dikinase
MHPRPFTLSFAQVAEGDLPLVGGKGANLAALVRCGVAVPPGFCVTTRAFDAFIAPLPGAEARFAALERLDGSSVDDARAAAHAMREALGVLPVPEEVAREIASAWRALGEKYPLAVRSSVTAEDLPAASFAGQQDTYLNVLGEAALLDAVRRCWISLFTDRAVLYRAHGAGTVPPENLVRAANAVAHASCHRGTGTAGCARSVWINNLGRVLTAADN